MFICGVQAIDDHWIQIMSTQQCTKASTTSNSTQARQSPSRIPPETMQSLHNPSLFKEKTYNPPHSSLKTPLEQPRSSFQCLESRKEERTSIYNNTTLSHIASFLQITYRLCYIYTRKKGGGGGSWDGLCLCWRLAVVNIQVTCFRSSPHIDTPSCNPSPYSCSK
jgi:hypothetical protein